MVRNTHQKAVVQRVIMEMPGHQTADAVFDQVRQEIPTVGKATVYRILGQLADQGTVRRIQTLDRADIFDKRTDQHYHVRCTCCGAVQDMELPPLLQDLQQLSSCSGGFALTGHDVVFRGICPNCQVQASCG